VVRRVTPTITKAAPVAIQTAPVAFQVISVQVPELQATLVFCPWTSAAVPPTIKPPPTIVRIFPVLLQCRLGAGRSDEPVPESNATFRVGMPACNPDAGGNSLGETKSAAEAGKHVTNNAKITSMDKKRGFIKYVLLNFGQSNFV
jgi:hypothetical protein